MNSPVDDLLKLPGITVERYSQVEGCIFFELKILAAQVNCYRCSQSSQELHRRTTILPNSSRLNARQSQAKLRNS